MMNNGKKLKMIGVDVSKLKLDIAINEKRHTKTAQTLESYTNGATICLTGQ